MDNQRHSTPPEGFFDSLELALPKRLLIFIACALGSLACVLFIPGAAAGLAVVGIALLIAYVTAVLSNFMSNTAAANILIPIGITMCVGFEAEVVLPIALAASCAMCLPIATPPNALAFATGRCETRDFIRLGVLIGIIAPAGSMLWVWLISTWARSVG